MKKINILLLLIFSWPHYAEAQYLSGYETVQYIQKVFDNYKIKIDTGDKWGRYDNVSFKITYNNPVVTIAFDYNTPNNVKNLVHHGDNYKIPYYQILFNINDVIIDTIRSFALQGRYNNNEVSLNCNSCISYNKRIETTVLKKTDEKDEHGWSKFKTFTSSSNDNTIISQFIIETPENIVALRLRNAFQHLQSISGKGKSAPDPFDPIPTQNANSNNNAINNNTSGKQSQVAKSIEMKTYKSSKFSINYPYRWELIQNPNQYTPIAIIAPENGNNFKSNFNVNVSNRTESLEKLFQLQQQGMLANKNILVGYQLDKKEYVTVNGISGIKSTASYKLDGYAVKGIQYILRKTNNTVYVITFTVGTSSYEKDRNLIEQIIRSFKSI